MPRFLTLCLLSLSLIARPGMADDNRYSISDLESLAKNKSWEEILQHLEDIPDSRRDERWRKLGETAATSYLESVSTGVDPFAGLTAAEDLLKRFPFLKKSRAVHQARDRVAMKGFETCFGLSDRGGGCLDRMTRFVHAEKEGAEIAFRAGKLAAHAKAYAEAIPFFKHFLANASDKMECADEDVVRSVIYTLSQSPSSAFVADAREIATESCPERMKPYLKEALSRLKKLGELGRNICSYMKENGDLDDKLRARCDRVTLQETD